MNLEVSELEIDSEDALTLAVSRKSSEAFCVFAISCVEYGNCSSEGLKLLLCLEEISPLPIEVRTTIQIRFCAIILLNFTWQM